MLVTAMNKMRRGETVRVHFSESLVSSLDIPHAAAAQNYRSFANLIARLDRDHKHTDGSPTMASGVRGTSHHHRWEEVGSEAVLEFLRDYRASANVCFAPDSGGTTRIAEYVRTMVAKGELGTWTVALVGTSRKERAAIPDTEYRIVRRNLDADKLAVRKNQYTFQGVAMGQDEAIDLDEQEHADALAEAERSGDRRSRAAFYRLNRPATRGLLLLYPIIPVDPADKDLELEHPVIGVAVSFPKSDRDEGQEYVCNPRMLKELFGEQFAEDVERDETEDVAEKPPAGGARP